MILFLFCTSDDKQSAKSEETVKKDVERFIDIFDSMYSNEPVDTIFKYAFENLQNVHTYYFSDTITASAYFFVAKALNIKGQYETAEVYYDSSLALARNIFSERDSLVGVLYKDIGINFRKQEKFDKAQEAFTSALNIFKEKHGAQSKWAAKILMESGNNYLLSGNLEQAESLLDESLQIYTELFPAGDKELSSIYNSLGNLHWSFANYEKAAYYIEENLKIAELENDDHAVASALSNLAPIYKRLGKKKEAIELSRRAVEIREKIYGPKHNLVAKSLNNLATAYLSVYEYDNALPILLRVLAIYEDNYDEYNSNIALTKVNLGSCYLSVNKFDSALFHYEDARRIYEKVYGPDHLYMTFIVSAIAKIYAIQGNNDESMAHFKKLIKKKLNFIEYAFNFSSEDQKIRWIERCPPIEDAFLSYVLNHPSQVSLELAAEMILKGKAVFTESILQNRKAAYCSSDDNLIDMMEEHRSVCEQIANLALFENKGKDPLDVLNRTKERIEINLSKKCVEFKKNIEIQRFTLNDVIRCMPDKSALWDILKYEPFDYYGEGSEKQRTGKPEYLGLFLNNKGETNIYRLGNVFFIDSLINIARDNLNNPSDKLYSSQVAEAERELQEVTNILYDSLFAPIERELNDITDVFIASDGLVNLLPFEILWTNENQYLLEKYKITYMSSGRDIINPNKEESPNRTFVLFANPVYKNLKIDSKITSVKSRTVVPDDIKSKCLDDNIPHLRFSQTEADNIAELVAKTKTNAVVKYYFSEATEHNLKSLPETPKVLHLSTHGFFCEASKKDNKNSLVRSGLLLADYEPSGNTSNDKDDGILTALEASGLNLYGTDLVTLSACETGIGNIVNGEGVFGLRKAFQHAGAEALLMSMWKIPDKQTADLMTSFYDKWLDGKSKADALRESSLELMHAIKEKHNHAHPYFWSGFILFGNPN